MLWRVHVADEMAQPHRVAHTLHTAMLCDTGTVTGAPGQCVVL